jgi:small subunit ribosomal protein S16
VAVKIKLKRLGKIRAPYYRIVVADARTKRDGRAIEEIGKYHPKADPSFIEVNSERAQHWLSVGAQPTDPVRKILEITGDWQKHKGLPGAEGTLRTAEPKEDRKVAFAAALQETLDEGGSTTKAKARGKAGDSAAAKTSKAGGKSEKADKPDKAESAKAESAKAEPAKAESAKAEPAKTESAKAEKAPKGEKAAKADDAPQDAATPPAETPAAAEAAAPAEATAAETEAAPDAADGSASSEG